MTVAAFWRSRQHIILETQLVDEKLRRWIEYELATLHVTVRVESQLPEYVSDLFTTQLRRFALFDPNLVGCDRKLPNVRLMFIAVREIQNCRQYRSVDSTGTFCAHVFTPALQEFDEPTLQRGVINDDRPSSTKADGEI